MKNLIRIILMLLLSGPTAFGQRVENTSSCRNVGSDRYARLNYENDFFAMSDEYYSQGVNLEFAAPAMQKFFLSRLLFQNKYLPSLTGIAVEHQGFTPTNILTGEVLKYDRPYSASLMLKTFSIVSNPYTSHRIATQLSLGVIGPWAMGKEIQTAIHERLNPDKVPKGWNNQVHNDVIINYQVDYEHALLINQHFLLTAKGGGRLGTYNTRLHASVVLMAGLFDNPFRFVDTHEKNFQVYLYTEPQVNLVIFDATLQGGVFNDRNPYTLGREEISRLVYKQNAGLVIKIHALMLEYAQSVITREFKTGSPHSWGSVRLAFTF